MTIHKSNQSLIVIGHALSFVQTDKVNELKIGLYMAKFKHRQQHLSHV